MSPVALFVVGAPGAGKTTLVRRLLGMKPSGELPPRAYLVPKPKWTVLAAGGSPFAVAGVCAAGHYTGGTFDGADTVPYNGAADALRFWAAQLVVRCAVTVFDGDRFSDSTSLAFVRQHAAVKCVYLSAPETVLAERRALRGSKQAPAWMAGRATKARRFAEALHALSISATAPQAEAVAQVLSHVGASPQ